MDTRRLLDTLTSAPDRELEQARASMAPAAACLAWGVERMALASDLPLDAALPLALAEVRSMLVDRLRGRLGPGGSGIARALAVELGDEALRLATDLAAEEAEILRRDR